jgi:hypothetical protein
MRTVEIGPSGSVDTATGSSRVNIGATCRPRM